MSSLIDDVAFLVDQTGGAPYHNTALTDAAQSLKQGEPVDWESLVAWDKLSEIRDRLDKLPHPPSAFNEEGSARISPGGGPKTGYLGLQFDDERLVVGRQGCAEEVDLSDSRLSWEILRALEKVRDAWLPPERLEKVWETAGNVEGTPEKGTVNDAISKVNKRLARLGVKIKSKRNVGRRLEAIEDTPSGNRKQKGISGRARKRVRPAKGNKLKPSHKSRPAGLAK